MKGYVALLYEAVPILNDRVGGVTVTIKDDLSKGDPALLPGKTVTLRGNQTLAYVRRRMDVADGTKINRMGRHREYLNSFKVKLKSLIKEDSSIINELYEDAEPYMVTNLTVSRVSSVMLEGIDYESGGIVTTEGKYSEETYSTGKTHVEYHIDEDKLKELVLSLLYIQIDGNG